MDITFGQWIAQGGSYVAILFTVICGAGAAGGYLWKAWRAARRPGEERRRYVDEAISEHDHFRKCLDRDKKRIDSMEESIKLLLRGQMQLITHELDGNHVDKLAEVRDAIHDHLLER